MNINKLDILNFVVRRNPDMVMVMDFLATPEIALVAELMGLDPAELALEVARHKRSPRKFRSQAQCTQ